MQSEELNKAGVPLQICGDETLFDVFFTKANCRDYRSAQHDDPNVNGRYNASLRRNGIFKSPGKLYPCLAHTQQDLDQTREGAPRGAPRLQVLKGSQVKFSLFGLHLLFSLREAPARPPLIDLAQQPEAWESLGAQLGHRYAQVFDL